MRIHGRHRHDILDIVARLQDMHWRYSAITELARGAGTIWAWNLSIGGTLRT